MGFSKSLSKRALKETMQGGRENVQNAVEWILPRLGDEEEEEEEEKSTGKDDNISKDVSNSSSAPKKRRKILIELQKLFAFLQGLNKKAISTKSLTDSFGWRDNEIGQQHDVHELNRVLFEAIETSLRNTPSQNLLDKLYHGKLVNKVKCNSCGCISEIEEHFQDITTVVRGYQSLVYSLEDFVLPQLLEKDNQYFCEICNGKRNASRWVCFREIPPLLIFSLARFDYDFMTGNRKKNSEQFHYPLTIDMNPFTETNDYYSNTDDNSKNNERKKAKDLSLYEPEYNENSPYLYDLVTIIIHTGKSGNHGHYHAYIKDILNEGNWIYKPESVAMNTSETTSFHKNHKRSASDDYNNSSTTTTTATNDLIDKDKENFSIENLPKSSIAPTQDDITNTCGNNRLSSNNNNTSQSFIIPEFIKKEEIPKPEDNDETSGWYDFNDSSINSIPLKTLRTQFGGKSECAYMLVYRKRNNDIKIEEDENIIIPTIPPFLQEMVDKKNDYLKEKREKQENELNKIDIRIYYEKQFSVDSFGIARLLPISDTRKNPITISFDRRNNIKELKEKILEELHPIYALDDNNDDEIAKLLSDIQIMRILQEHLVLPNPSKILGDNSSLIECNIHNGTELFIWNSTTINHKIWNPFDQVVYFTIHVLSPSILNEDTEKETNFVFINSSNNEPLYKSNTSNNDFRINSNTYTFELTWNTKLEQFQSLISECCGIIPSDQKMFLLDKTDDNILKFIREVTEIKENNNENNEYYLKNLNIDTSKGNIIITIENKNHSILNFDDNIKEKENTSNLVDNFIVLKNQFVSFKLKNQLNGKSNPKLQIIDVLAEQSCTLWEIKQIILNHINLKDLDLDNVRYRRIGPEGVPRTIYQNEKLSIGSIPILNGSSLILEHGESPSSEKMKLLCKLSSSVDEKTISIYKNWSIPHCIEVLKQEFGCNPEDKYILRRTDLWGKVTNTVSTNYKTIKDAKLKSGDLYVLEKPAKGGQFLVPLILFEYIDRESPNTILSSFCEELKDKSNEDDNEEEKLNLLTILNDEEDIEDWALYSPALFTKNAPDSFFVTDLGAFPIDKEINLLQCKEKLINSVPLLAAASSPSNIRIWHKGKLMKDNNILVKDLYSFQNPFVIQVLGISENLSTSRIPILIYKRNSTKKIFSRPIEYIIDNTNVDEKNLLKWISVDFNISIKSLQAFHYSTLTHNWKSLNEENDTSPIEKTKTNKVDLGEIFTGSSNITSSNIGLPLIQENKSKFSDGGNIIIKYAFINYIY